MVGGQASKKDSSALPRRSHTKTKHSVGEGHLVLPLKCTLMRSFNYCTKLVFFIHSQTDYIYPGAVSRLCVPPLQTAELPHFNLTQNRPTSGGLRLFSVEGDNTDLMGYV